MSLQKWYPWNWFKHEESADRSLVPIRRSAFGSEKESGLSLSQLHRQIDRLFDEALGGFGFPSLDSRWSLDKLYDNGGFYAKLNVASDEHNYHISVEAPGMTEKDISLELAEGRLTIRGEKQEDSSSKDRHYYRVERSYGSFARVLALPEDSDAESISAKMNHGILEITLPRKPLATGSAKRIPISS